MICIGANDLRVIGRNTQGVRLVNLKEGDRLVSAAVLDPEDVEEGVDTAEEGADTAVEGAVSDVAPESESDEAAE